MKNFFEKPFVVPSFIFGVLLLIGLWLVGSGIAARNSGNIISTTGSASTNVTADSASWSLNLNQTVSRADLTNASAAITADAVAAAKVLAAQNLASSSVTESIVSINQNYSNNGEPVTYDVSESVTVQTGDVQKIDQLSHTLAPFQAVISSDTILSPQSPQYYISTLPELRVSLIGQAVADAKARAQEIAKSGGSTVGALSSASSGVVQVTSPNSTSADDYGSYDTSTIQKQVMVTAHASFYVK